MDRVPEEIIYRHAFHEASVYFAKKIEQKRRAGFVAVLVEDFYESIYFAPCNKEGYPQLYQLETLELPRISASFLTEGEITTTDLTVARVTIQIDKPLLAQRLDWENYPIVFMWSGKKLGTDRIPIENLNIKELMRVAQIAIKNREGLVIDEALKNKIYK